MWKLLVVQFCDNCAVYISNAASLVYLNISRALHIFVSSFAENIKLTTHETEAMNKTEGYRKRQVYASINRCQIIPFPI